MPPLTCESVPVHLPVSTSMPSPTRPIFDRRSKVATSARFAFCMKTGLPVSRLSVPNSSTSVPVSAGLVSAPLTAPVRRFTNCQGSPVGESNAGSRRVPRSRASSSRRVSCVSS